MFLRVELPYQTIQPPLCFEDEPASHRGLNNKGLLSVLYPALSNAESTARVVLKEYENIWIEWKNPTRLTKIKTTTWRTIYEREWLKPIVTSNLAWNAIHSL